MVGGSALYGYTTLPARATDTAANYGGGDWGTLSNIVPTVAGMINALAAKRYHGPFGLYASPTQYNQAALTYFSDGSGETGLKRLMNIPQIKFAKPSDFLADGVIILVQLTRNVVDLAVALELSNREWMSGDGMANYFKVMMAQAPRLKTDYAGNAGICHATGA